MYKFTKNCQAFHLKWINIKILKFILERERYRNQLVEGGAEGKGERESQAHSLLQGLLSVPWDNDQSKIKRCLQLGNPKISKFLLYENYAPIKLLKPVLIYHLFTNLWSVESYLISEPWFTHLTNEYNNACFSVIAMI